ncbi:hypothetical protein [Streptomyces sp. NBC_01500]|uniref:hypothetical protein n=1 Tax=Streptomyces sp. NBC_01500 TaxID=2903886 RepID=UPI00224E966B|nr:hypothetical protein [Streptomyces sp. NBC_01500]MCX4554153.1 hypothetical protein [Streptomyces sp. NBC_01500]
MSRAFVRTSLRGALELHHRYNIWTGTEYVNAARAMSSKGSPDLLSEYVNAARAMSGKDSPDLLSDDDVWELDKVQMLTIKRALDWRMSTMEDNPNAECYELIRDEINGQLRALYHSEGKYWM